jgi:hypothetical protein
MRNSVEVMALPDMQIPFDTIDWSRPWLEGVRSIAAPIIAVPNWRAALNASASRLGLRNHQGKAINFVPQAELPEGMPYETFISLSGCVPTRENFHDFFNALVWLAYPQIKSRLNFLQATEIERQRARGAPLNVRGALRDAVTIFDENAAIVVLRNSSGGRELGEALTEHRWHEAFVARADSFGQDCEVWIFGHALMEKLVHPYKAITAHAYLIEAEEAFFDSTMEARRRWVDATVEPALAVTPAIRLRKTPLPVAGIPGWALNQDSVFYNDTAVFRPKRRQN